jgi:HNH endonuclease
MSDMDSDTAMRLAAFAHIKQLMELRDALTANDLAPAAKSQRRASLEALPICDRTSQRNRAAAVRFREASRARAPDSPCRASAGARTAWPTKNSHAIVTNGIPLSKIHHAEFDAHLIGIDPDYRLHVSPQLLEQNDRPMLEGLKKLQGVSVRLPKRPKDFPDRERLSLRFERFRAAY